MQRITIRPETPSDAGAITAVLVAAFGGPVEANLVARLRADGDLALPLVAERAAEIVGHVAFTALAFDPPQDLKAWALAPLAVAPAVQNQGIGAALVHAGLLRARQAEIGFVAVLGEPAYYERFGFRAELARGLEVPWAGPHFMGLCLASDIAPPQGTPRYAPAFAALA